MTATSRVSFGALAQAIDESIAAKLNVICGVLYRLTR